MADAVIGPIRAPFYVYVYRDPRPGKDLQPIYVGKGTAALHRATLHWRQGGQNPLLRGILAKIKADGLVPVIEIDSWFDDEGAALEREAELIALFGRRDLGLGTLANMADGGRGPQGWIASADWRARRSVLTQRQFSDPKQREAQSERLKARMAQKKYRDILYSPEVRDKVNTALRKPENREVARARIKGFWADPEMAAFFAECSKDRWANPETRARILERQRDKDVVAAARAKTKTQWADPVQRVRMLKARRAAREAKKAAGGRTLEEKRRQAEANLAAWADPEQKAARVAKCRATRAANKAAKLAAQRILL